MCGIAGFVGNSIERDKRIEMINRMNAKLIHRGPDADGIWLDEKSGITLGHRRLAIQDLSPNGAQPMYSHSERFVMVYNGEIYNAEELKKALANVDTCDMKFRGTSDTEILLEAMEHLGITKTLSVIKGMFAIALYDRQERCLTLMRDRAGEKPLFYGFLGGQFVFASELNAITAVPGFQQPIAKKSVSEFICYGYIPAPATIYEGIYKLMPGSMLTIKAPFQSEMVREEKYYSLAEVAKWGEEHPFRGSLEEATEQLDYLLKQSIQGQMISDVPLGAYLSGGIDSATIVALMSELCANKVKTFTIGFEEKKYNEATFAKEIAAHLGTEHTECYVSEKELKSVIPLIPRIYGEPFADSSQIPTYLVSKLAKEKVTVSLSGDAGDELFCGYRNYGKLMKLWNQTGNIPTPFRSIAAGMGKGAAACINFIHPATARKFYRGALCLTAKDVVEMKEAVGHTNPLMDRLAYSDVPIQFSEEWKLQDACTSLMLHDMLHYHPDDILVKVDRAGMAVSLENRIPMLDKDVMEFAFSLPLEYKFDGTITKKVLRKVLYRYVPEHMMDRPKKGFSVPLERWLKEGDTAEWTRELLNDCKVAKAGLLDGRQVDKLWKQFEKETGTPRLVWNVLMLEQWYRSITENKSENNTRDNFGS